MNKRFTLFLLSLSLFLAMGSKAMADVLCFTAGEDDSHVTLTKTDQLGTLVSPVLEYSTDGATWQPLAYDAPVALAFAGDKMYVRGNNTGFSAYFPSSYIHFTMDGTIAASGNVMSLVDSTCVSTTIPSAYCFTGLFEGCQSLVSAPELPATILTAGCYDGMFANCISLTEAPALPANSMAFGCYKSMFENCTALAKASALPAEKLAAYCYKSMFSGCGSLQTAPALPATQLASNCYSSMFNGCSQLHKIEVLFADWATALNATDLWVNAVATSGTFVCPTELAPLTQNNNMVPVGWIIKNPVYLDSLQVSLTKTYDYTRACQVLDPGTVRGIRDGEDAQLVVDIAYNDSAAATGKTIAVRFAITGSDNSHYIAPDDYTYSTQGVILPKQLTAAGIEVDTIRVYNATNVADITTPASLVGVLGTDNVALASEALFDDKNVGQNKTVTLTHSISGAQASNYLAPVQASFTHSQITPKTLTATGLVVQTVKDYDFSDTAQVLTQPTVDGIIAGDDYHVSASAYYDDKYIGKNKTITAVYALSGADLHNYTLAPDTFIYTTAGEIRGKYLLVRNLEIDTTRIYNGTDQAFVHTTYTTLGLQEEDDVQLSIRAWYDDKHIGTDKTVFYSLHLSGADAAAYNLQDGDTLVYSRHGSILPRQLEAHGAEVEQNKMYDTTNEAYLINPGTLHNVAEGDNIELNTVATYESAQPGYYYDITIQYAVSGDIADYLAPESELTSGTIYDSIRVESDFYGEGLCEGGETLIGAFVSRGAEPLYKSYITWSEEAKKAGLEDGEVYRFMPDNYWEDGYEFHYLVPDSVRDGIHEGTIRLFGPINGYYEDYPITVEVNGSWRLMDSIFADVISIDNREERFFSYQWQHFNQETWEFEDIPGATLPYYQQEGGLDGQYRVLLNAGTDTELLTCERYFYLPEPEEAVAARKEVQSGHVVVITPEGNTYSTTGQSIR